MTYNEQLKLIKEQANINNTWSASQAQKQMDFQERMSNTAHQREMADLKAAGLNPVLAANSGASIPSGAMGSTDETSTGAIADFLKEMMVQESANARAAIKAATTAAAAAKKNNSYYSNDPYYKMMDDFVYGLTGQNVQELVVKAGQNVANLGEIVREDIAKSGKWQIDKNSGKAVTAMGDYPIPTYETAKQQINYIQGLITSAKTSLNKVFSNVKSKSTHHHSGSTR